MSNLNEVKKVGDGLAECMAEFEAFILPWTAKVVSITDDPDGRETVASVLASSVLIPIFLSLDNLSKATFLASLEQKIPQLRASLASSSTVN